MHVLRAAWLEAIRTCEFGIEWGGEAAGLQRRVDDFRGLVGSMDAALAELGRAGLRLYEPAHRDAPAAEEHARITRQG